MTNILQELNDLLSSLGVRAETGIFKGKAPDEYVVVTPMSDIYGAFADDQPQYETQEARLSLFSKANYIPRKNQIVKALLAAEFVITERIYIGYEEDTKADELAGFTRAAKCFCDHSRKAGSRRLYADIDRTTRY